jgi:hypothetical protein
MRYLLMNCEHETAELEIPEKPSVWQDIKIIEEIDKDRLPFKLKARPEIEHDWLLQQWMLHRIIPDNRQELGRLYLELGPDRMQMSLNSYGQSLADSFWFKKVNDPTKFSEINYRTHGFSYDVGNYMIHHRNDITCTNSPDLTTNGRLKKVWRIRDRKRYLLKFGSAPYYEEPFNEVASSAIMGKIGLLPYVPYHLDFIGKEPVCYCKDFLNDGEEFIPASDLCPAHTDVQQVDAVLKEKCSSLNIPGYQDFFLKMRLFDYIIGNPDRHLGNFGFIWNSEHMAFTGPAPIFDNGDALFGDPQVKNTYLQDRNKILEIFNLEHSTIGKIHIPALPDGMIASLYKASEHPEEGAKIEQQVQNRLKSYHRVLEYELDDELEIG